MTGQGRIEENRGRLFFLKIRTQRLCRLPKNAQISASEITLKLLDIPFIKLI